jgi:hypothetical protein
MAFKAVIASLPTLRWCADNNYIKNIDFFLEMVIIFQEADIIMRKDYIFFHDEAKAIHCKLVCSGIEDK